MEPKAVNIEAPQPPLHERLRAMARHCDSASYTSGLDKNSIADLLHEAADATFAHHVIAGAPTK